MKTQEELEKRVSEENQSYLCQWILNKEMSTLVIGCKSLAVVTSSAKEWFSLLYLCLATPSGSPDQTFSNHRSMCCWKIAATVLHAYLTTVCWVINTVLCTFKLHVVKSI